MRSPITAGALLALALLTLASIRAHAQSPLVLSERVGETIDSTELVYFGLFGRIPNVASARAVSVGDGADVVLRRATAPDTTVHLDAGSLRDLMGYIDRYEQEHAGVPTHDWGRYPLHRPRQYFLDGEEITIYTMTDERIEGRILFIDDRGLIVWLSEDRYDWRRLGTDARAVPAGTIRSMSQRGPFLLGAAVGIATVGGLTTYLYLESEERRALPIVFSVVASGMLGGAVSSLAALDETIDGRASGYRAHLPRLANAAMFTLPRIAPELPRFADTALIGPALAPDAVAMIDDEELAPLGRFHLTATGGYLTAPIDEKRYVVNTGAAGANRNVTHGTLAWSLDAMYDLSSWFAVGASASVRIPSVEQEFVDREVVTLYGGGLFADVSARPSHRSGFNVELHGALGVGTSYAIVEGQLVSQSRQRLRYWSREGFVPMVFGKVYLVQRLSDLLGLHIGFEGRVYGDATMPDYTYDAGTGVAYKTVFEHKPISNSLDVTIGFRARF